MREIKLTQGKSVIVDDSDFEWLNQWKWCYNGRYAIRKIRKNKKQINIWMHRLINKTPIGFYTDHINRNSLDNRKLNLRIAFGSINQININFRKDNTSGYRGVRWNKKDKKYHSRITVNKKQIHLGSFNDIQAAWLARRWGERFCFKSTDNSSYLNL